MHRRHFLGTAAAAPLAAAQRSQRPNILYLHSHDTGRYIQPYGFAVPTPNLQKLATEGVLFRQAFCAAPTCSPSRTALLTGQNPHANGMLGLAHLGFRLKDPGRHILHTLRGEGYFSALAGVQHVASRPADLGYDRVLPARNNQAAQVAPVAAEFLRHPPAQPFYLEVGFFETHRPFHPAGAQQDARYGFAPAPLPDTPEVRADMAAYQASAASMDDGVGTVLRALESAGLAANTLVISTTDHGIPFPSMKCNLTDHGMGVMLILRGPGGFEGGRTTDAMVSQIDLFPTICDLAEIRHPEWLEGRSLLPLVRGEKSEINDQVFGEVTYHVAYEPRRAVRTRRWKYIRHFDERPTAVLPNCDDGPSKEVWVKGGWASRDLGTERLYDLLFDPGETHNLAGEPRHRAALDEMRGRLDAWMRATRDPLLAGPVPPPPGARVGSADAVTVEESFRKAGGV